MRAMGFRSTPQPMRSWLMMPRLPRMTIQAKVRTSTLVQKGTRTRTMRSVRTRARHHGHQVGEGIAEDEGEHGDPDADLRRVAKRLHVAGLSEQLGVVLEGEAGREEAPDEQPGERVEIDREEERQRSHEGELLARAPVSAGDPAGRGPAGRRRGGHFFSIQAAKRSFCFWFSFLPSAPTLPHQSSLIQNCRLTLSGAVVRSLASCGVRNSKAAELLGP